MTKVISLSGVWSLALGIALLLGGLLAGAAEPDRDSIEEAPITADDREHWAFQAIAPPNLPATERSRWTRNAIDCFVLSELEQEELEPAPEADRATLLRRLKLDLLGVPPTPEELEEFLQDDREQAYELRVEAWLASPRLGEQWSQAWLDLARFAETDGFEHDQVREQAWRYRDWVIAAINADIPYDQFIRHQLVGDLSGEPKHQIATMFCLASPDMSDINDQDLRRHERLNELTSTIGAVLLGLQMNCAQCHDHKYDPISHADFYRLRAVFEPAVPPLQRDQPFNLFDGEHASSQARLYFRGELRSPGPTLSPGFPRIALPAQRQPGAEAALPDETAQPEAASLQADRHQSSPREALAEWLFSSDNPLTARVIANRVWQHHFGRGLIDNPSDVGVVPGEPSHPELLDWIACFLRQQQWSLKALHREIVLSATYRQASHRGADTSQQLAWDRRLELDADNQLLSRFPRHRLTGETIRDSLLAVSGRIDWTAAGPSVSPPLPPELSGTLLKGQWKVSPSVSDHHRRSIYIFARRNLRYPLFDVFDRPDAGATCPQRGRSTTATQSLQMLNSPFIAECAAALNARVSNSLEGSGNAEDTRWIDQLYRIALSRPATDQEHQSLLDFFKRGGSRTNACLAILNTSEFIYVE